MSSVKKQKIVGAPAERTRLPDSFSPRHYDLNVVLNAPSKGDWSFDGTVLVRLCVLDDQATSIMCHATKDRVVITGARVIGGSAAVSVSDANREGQVELQFASPLAAWAKPFANFEQFPDAAGSDVQLKRAKDANEKWVELELLFKGPIHENSLNGLYKFYHGASEADDKQSEVGVTTFFEPCAARNMFPCWDEPPLKATFRVSFTGPAQWTVLNNVDAVSTEPLTDGSGRAKTQFGVTPLMSTYLLCVVAGKLQYEERRSPRSGCRVRTYSPVGYSRDKLVLPTELAVECLDFYEEQFGVPYPLNKLDQMALPAFAMGAEEQWGLITYVDVCLLLDNSSPKALQRRVLEIVAHEIAHQWFALATVLSFYVMDNLRPSYNAWETFIPRTELGMAVDQLQSTRTVNIDIESIHDIGESFDRITYCKGGTLMRMLLDFAGAEAVRKGLALYLRRHAYQCTVGTDMYDALSEACGTDVKKLMYGWINESGFPQVEVCAWPPAADGTVRLKQTRFGALASDGDGPVWNVPVRWAAGDKSGVQLLSERAGSLDGLAQCSGSDLLLLNHGRAGFFRAHYPPALLDQLGQAVRRAATDSASVKPAMDPRDRYGLVSDLLAAVQIGRCPPATLLQFVGHYGHEQDPDTMGVVASAVSYLRLLCRADQVAKDAFDARIIAMLEPAVASGWDAKPGEASDAMVLRGVTLAMLARCGHRPTVEEGLRRFRADPAAKSVHSELVATLYTMVGQHGSATDHQLMRDQVAHEASSPDRMVYLVTALSATPDAAVLQASLDWAAQDDSPVRRQDARALLCYVSSTPQCQQLAWDWFKKHFDDPGWLSTLPHNHKLNALTYGFAYADQQLADIQQFLAGDRSAEFRKGFQQFLEKLQIFADTKRKQSAQFIKFVREK